MSKISFILVEEMQGPWKHGQTFHPYSIEKEKNVKRVLIQKARHFAKSKTILVKFLYFKSDPLYVTRLFVTFLKLAFIYKKHETLRYVTFLYTKIQALRKKQDILRYVFIYKNPDNFAFRDFLLDF